MRQPKNQLLKCQVALYVLKRAVATETVNARFEGVCSQLNFKASARPRHHRQSTTSPAGWLQQVSCPQAKCFSSAETGHKVDVINALPRFDVAMPQWHLQQEGVASCLLQLLDRLNEILNF